MTEPLSLEPPTIVWSKGFNSLILDIPGAPRPYFLGNPFENPAILWVLLDHLKRHADAQPQVHSARDAEITPEFLAEVERQRVTNPAYEQYLAEKASYREVDVSDL